MPHSCLHPEPPEPSIFSHSSSGSSFESFCLSSNNDSFSESESESESNSQASVPNQPTLSEKPETKHDTKLKPSAKVDKTICSTAWSLISSYSKVNPQHPSRESALIDSSNSNIMNITSTGTSANARPSHTSRGNGADIRNTPPTLPHPTYWTSLTHPDLFKGYIDVECLLPRAASGSLSELATTTGSITTEDDQQEPFSKAYTNMAYITMRNTDNTKIIYDCKLSWISDHLFADPKLPAPFQRSLLENNDRLWRQNPETEAGNPTFARLPDLRTEGEVMNWLNEFSTSLGALHGLVNTADQARAAGCEDRTFDCEGSNKPLVKGLIPRKPDIVVIDRAYRQKVPAKFRLRWPLVQALVEVSTSERRYYELVTSLLEKASNVFDSQLHRRFILGLIFVGKGATMKFSLVLVDRVGAACSERSIIEGFSAVILARIIYAFKFANHAVLGADPKVTIDRFTGNPLSVVVDKQTFTIITEIHCSPFLFGRGTRVYIVKDQHGCYHILKDSWILSTHTDSEIEHIKAISNNVQQTADLPDRFRLLAPRFVAGENRVDTTAEPRSLLRSLGPARIRRRIVTGPIGDPITSYRSRSECLQALIDVVDQLKFFDQKCGLVHGDISINNIVLVRFLPNILAASPTLHSQATITHPPVPAAGQQLAASAPSRSSQKPPTTTMVGTRVSQPRVSFQTTENSQWETLKPCTKSGLSFNLPSGGSVIDFDYTRAKGLCTAKTSGTMPYMSIKLMHPTEPVCHQLFHDLESVCLVLLHIVRFTCGPAGTSVGDVKDSYRVAQWHHEHNIGILKDLKIRDIEEIMDAPLNFISDYWAPIASDIKELLKMVVDKNPPDINKQDDFFQKFRAILASALKKCENDSEEMPKYAAFTPPKVPVKKRARTKSLAYDLPERKSLRRLTESQGRGQHHFSGEGNVEPVPHNEGSESAPLDPN